MTSTTNPAGATVVVLCRATCAKVLLLLLLLLLLFLLTMCSFFWVDDEDGDHKACRSISFWRWNVHQQYVSASGWKVYKDLLLTRSIICCLSWKRIGFVYFQQFGWPTVVVFHKKRGMASILWLWSVPPCCCCCSCCCSCCCCCFLLVNLYW